MCSHDPHDLSPPAPSLSSAHLFFLCLYQLIRTAIRYSLEKWAQMKQRKHFHTYGNTLCLLQELSGH